MNYRPNPYAQNLIRRRSKVIGVVVPEFVNSFFPRIIIQIQKVFEKEGFNVLITQSGESAEIELKNLHLLENSMVEGIILSVTEKDRNDEYYRRLINNGIPIVFFNRPSNEVEASKVVIDDFRMAFFAVEHILYANRTKRTRPLHLMGPKGISTQPHATRVTRTPSVNTASPPHPIRSSNARASPANAVSRP